MKYQDLIQFEPIERVVQLKDANETSKAQQLVSTYVISKEMEATLVKRVFPLLDPHAPDAKGLLIVGNYGTGKSHLMSMISAICEFPELTDQLSNEQVKEKAADVSGEYKVIRMEIGSTKMGLRNIITRNIEARIREWDISFTFPADDQITENKSSIEDLMSSFQTEFPGKGLLIVVDELLDYLRTRNDHEITLDLGFLREIGEVCKDLKFRFIAGVQEAIFDSDRFAFVGESLTRVKDRFDQVRIEKTDISYVVSNRLLKKTDRQKEQVKAYLQPFASFYSGWTERLEDFVGLFPVHPDYVETFAKLPIVEQRGVLQVLSDNFHAMRDTELPEDYPGILSLDNFWAYLKNNPVSRTFSDIAITMDTSDILREKVKTGFPPNKKQYKDLALRIIDGLSVDRLTTGDINMPMGMTSEELRDKLCIYHPMVKLIGGDDPSEDLLTVIETTLKEIRSCVSGQYISSNEDNHQHYLDLKKTEDFDAIIEQRAETLDNATLDNAYFRVLQEILEIDVPTAFTGFQIWESNVPWVEKNATKLGWLFFGIPAERSTAQPARDFYLYFPQIISPSKFKDAQRDDEVFFRLNTKDESFIKPLRLYSAAIALQHNATGAKKGEYKAKADKHFRTLAKLINEQFSNKIEITFQGKKQLLSSALSGQSIVGKTSRELIDLAASIALNGHFQNLCGDYPQFNRLITFGKDGNIKKMVADALGYLNNIKTQTGATILDGLRLLDGETVSLADCSYAQYIQSKLAEKGQGQVLNANELVEIIDTVPYFSKPGSFRLETELLVVVLAALIYNGDLTLNITGKEFTAAHLSDLSQAKIGDLMEFKHVKMPKDFNIPAIKALYTLLELSPGLATQVTQNNQDAVQKLHTAIGKKVDALVMAKQEFGVGLNFWGMKLMEESQITKLSVELEETKTFLESLQAYNTPAKLKNFRYTEAEVNAHHSGLNAYKEAETLKAFSKEFSELTTYLNGAMSQLPEGHAWREQCASTQKNLFIDLQDHHKLQDTSFKKKTRETLTQLKEEYIALYLDLHKTARLDHAQDQKKRDLLQGSAMEQLKALSTIPMMPIAQLTEIQEEFGKLKTGTTLTSHDLQSSPTAGEFFPAMEVENKVSAAQRLLNLEQKVEETHRNWTASLLNEFEDLSIKDHIELLAPTEQSAVTDFLDTKELPSVISPDLLKGMNQALSGLTSIQVTSAELEQALFPGGSAATLDEIEARFTSFLKNKSKGQDRTKIRLVHSNT